MGFLRRTSASHPPIGPFVAVFIAVSCAAAGAASDNAVVLPDYTMQIRTTDRHMQRLVERGLKHSPTFRGLVDRLMQSDVVVYLEPDTTSTRGIDGRLLFLATHGDTRYVVVRIGSRVSHARQVAMLAHELQHAIEVAEAPRIVDHVSMAEAFSQFGFATNQDGDRRFDTREAIAAGKTTLKELLGRAPAPATGMTAD